MFFDPDTDLVVREVCICVRLHALLLFLSSITSPARRSLDIPLLGTNY